MAPQSRAHKRLVRLYRLVIWRMRVHCAVARREFLERLPLRLHVELLQPRMLMSVAPAGGELLLNQAIGSTQQSPAVAVDASGNTVAVWQSLGEDGDGWGIYGRRFDSSGNALGNEFLVNTTTTHDQVNPAIALTSSGAFVVVWTSNQSG
ncbi:MAG: repeat-containing protein, partial [Phycisphaerales bacterium]|nr:repeat-containing protein [Phycisphaerales bacterium]